MWVRGWLAGRASVALWAGLSLGLAGTILVVVFDAGQIGSRRSASALVLALLPTAVAANKGNEVIKFVVIGAAVLIFFGLIIYRQYKYATWSAKRSTTVTAPAGKAGLLFDATATPPTVTGLAALSPLRGEVEVGWRLAEVDDVDVSEMSGAAATQLL